MKRKGCEEGSQMWIENGDLRADEMSVRAEQDEKLNNDQDIRIDWVSQADPGSLTHSSRRTRCGTVHRKSLEVTILDAKGERQNRHDLAGELRRGRTSLHP